MSKDELSLETYKESVEFLRIANRAAKKAQEENRKKGIPNVYSFNGHIYYELPNGDLTERGPACQSGKRGVLNASHFR